VLPQTTAGFQDAVAFYRSRLDKKYSLVDCRSMVAMQSLGLTGVLSNDHHFSQEGFTVLFP
jgi:predicted nucleic acid-binding protein